MSVTPSRDGHRADDHEKYRLKGSARNAFEDDVLKLATTAQQRHIVRTLLGYAGGKPDCWPTNEKLEKDTLLSPRHIRRILSDLAKHGAVHLIPDRSLRTQRRVVLLTHPNAKDVLAEHGIHAPREDMGGHPQPAPREDKNGRCREAKSGPPREDMGGHRTYNSLNPEFMNPRSFDRRAPLSLSENETVEREREGGHAHEEGGQPEALSWEGGGSSEAAIAAFRSLEAFVRERAAAKKPSAWWTIDPEKSLALHFARDLVDEQFAREVGHREKEVLSVAGTWGYATMAFATVDRLTIASKGAKLKYLLAVAKNFRDRIQEIDPSTASHMERRRGELQEAREQAEFEWEQAKAMEVLAEYIPEAAAMQKWLEAVERDQCGNRGEGALDTGFMRTLPLVLTWIEGDWDGARSLIQAEVDRNPQVTWHDLWDVLCRWKPLTDLPDDLEEDAE